MDDDSSQDRDDQEDVTRDLHTLDHWREQLSGWPRTIECSSMRLVGYDDEGDIFAGPGRIEILNETEMRFFLYGTTSDSSAAMKKYLKAKKNPYNVREQFRLFATDFRGVEWNGGWTDVDFFTDHSHGWPLSGELQSLLTVASGPWVSKRSSVELLLVPPIDLPMTESLMTKAHIGKRQISYSSGPGQHSLTLLGTTVTFSYEPSDKALWITADTSPEFNHPHAENWLSEPLRILLGAPIYPRMVARNFGNGTAHIWLRPSPRQKVPSAIGLMRPFSMEPGRTTKFWELYAQILEFIAKAGEFDANPITKFYDELSQSQLGSRWVLTLTLASTAEAIANSLMTGEDRKSEFSDSALLSMRKHISDWNEDAGLRQRMLSNLGVVKSRSVVAFMREIGKAGTVNSVHVQTWYKIRNSVMHGDLVEPWSSAESDQHLEEMLQLVHDLTRARIRTT